MDDHVYAVDKPGQRIAIGKVTLDHLEILVHAQCARIAHKPPDLPSIRTQSRGNVPA